MSSYNPYGPKPFKVSYRNYQKAVTLPHNGYSYYTGTWYNWGFHERWVADWVRLQVNPGYYSARISIAVLSAPSGGFDQHDSVLVDIFSVDDNELALGKEEPWDDLAHSETNPPTQLGGMGPIGCPDIEGDGSVHKFETQAQISSYLGPILGKIIFRVAIQGDNLVGATYSVQQIGPYPFDK